MILSGELAVQQAPMFDGLPFDPFALFYDGFGPAEVGVGGRHVGQRFVVSLMVVVLDERFDLGLKVAGQEVVFEQDAILEGLMQRSILPWVCGCIGAPRTWVILLASIYS